MYIPEQIMYNHITIVRYKIISNCISTVICIFSFYEESSGHPFYEYLA